MSLIANNDDGRARSWQKVERWLFVSRSLAAASSTHQITIRFFLLLQPGPSLSVKILSLWLSDFFLLLP
jgi:hypothetical protein